MNYVFTIPNAVTLSRLILLPFFILAYLSDKAIFAAALLLLMGFSDVLDGFLARVLKKKSEFGSRFDKFSDLIVMLCIVSVLFLKSMPQFFLAVFTTSTILVAIYCWHLLSAKKIANTKYGRHISITLFTMAIMSIFNLFWQPLFLVLILFVGMNTYRFILSSTRKRTR